MIIELIKPDHKRMCINSDHISYMDNIGLTLLCGKTVPLTPGGYDRLIHLLTSFVGGEYELCFAIVDMRVGGNAHSPNNKNPGSEVV